MSKLLPGLRPAWIAFGWFIAVAITSLVLLALVAMDVIGNDPRAEGVWVAAALAIGFGLAGYYAGTRVAAAPLAHGLGIGLFSLPVWLAANLFLGEPTDQTAWTELAPTTAAALLTLVTTAAVVGTRIGVRTRRRAAITNHE